MSRERQVPPGTIIVSKTDLQGNITFVNDAFVEISGFSREEVLGKPHNVIRHRDMPKEAFGNLWETLRKGEAWVGFVKNRTKDGGYYWVKSVVTNIKENNRTIGYQSVRTHATSEEVQRAEALYCKIRNKEPLYHWWQPTTWGVRVKLFSLLISYQFLCQIALFYVLSNYKVHIGYNLAFLIVGGFINWGIASLSTKKLRKAADSSKQLVDNTLSKFVFTGGLDEVSQLQLALIMCKSIKMTALGQIHESSAFLAKSVQSNSSEIESLVKKITEGVRCIQNTQKATHSVDGLLDEILSVFPHLMENSQQSCHTLDEIVKQAKGVEESNRTVFTNVSTNKELVSAARQSGAEISSYVEEIQKISDQTNLLALNASIEAARAGDAGKGFAVVAGEVRTLSLRTKEVSDCITKLIQSLTSYIDTAHQNMSNNTTALTDIQQRLDAIFTSIFDVCGNVKQVDTHFVDLLVPVQNSKTNTQTILDLMSKILQSKNENLQAAKNLGERNTRTHDLATNLSGVVVQFQWKLYFNSRQKIGYFFIYLKSFVIELVSALHHVIIKNYV